MQALANQPEREVIMDVCDSTPAKICTKCGEEKPVNDFHKDKQRSDGLRPSCKVCKNTSASEYRAQNPERGRAYALAWAAANPEKKKAAKAAWRAANRDKVNAESAAYRLRNPEKLKAAEFARYNGNPEKEKARVAAYRTANEDKVKAYAEAYRAANPEKARMARNAWRAANPEKVRVAVAKWRAENPEANRIHVHNRRAKKRQNGGKLSKGLAAKLFKLQRGLCPCCRQPLGDAPHLDHISPLALGGRNDDENMQLLRAVCNQQKHAKHPVDFMQSRGFLL